ncbi:AAA family ATPase [Paenibacillus aestuarii]|uniref:AAA family ATPase n=1 Tax=Paenibacillus aestuarii TaxID=516965 RepID=A0ABW0KJE1_9BACL|nr:AAA family ATPase [Paenibacillus aestuarii]
MAQPLFIIVNGLPGAGKSTLANRLAHDLHVPLFSRDRIYETLFDAMDCPSNGCPPLLAPAAFTMMYASAGTVLAAGQPVMIEGFFGRPEIRSAELLQLQQAYPFEPLQIVCRANGEVLLRRFHERIGSVGRHASHSDLSWIEQEGNKERLLQGDLTPLSIGGTIREIETTTPDSFDYTQLLQEVSAELARRK